MKLCYYQLLDFRQGVRENLMKGQGVRVHIKVKNHCAGGKGGPARIGHVTLWPIELMRSLRLQLSELPLLVFITLLPLLCVPLVALRIRLRRTARTEPSDMPLPLTLITTHVLTTSLTTIVSWPLPCHSVYNPNVDGANVLYRHNAQLWTRVLHYRNALGEN